MEHILKIKEKPRTLESYRNEWAAENLHKILPPVKQRSLQEYSSLLGDNRLETSSSNVQYATCNGFKRAWGLSSSSQ